MNITQLIDEGLQYLTNRRTKDMTTTKVKNVSRKRKESPGRAEAVCGACGGEIVEVNAITHRRVCFKCGKIAQ